MMLSRSTVPIQLCRRTFSVPVEDILHRSQLRTDHFQRSLPRLAIPPLEDTLNRYITSQSVLLSDDALAAHKRLVDEFQKGEGPELQKALQEYAKARPHTSYITEFWFDMYLRDRRRIPLTHTPYMSMVLDPQSAYNAPRLRATNMLYSTVRFHNALRLGCLSPEVFYLDPKQAKSDNFRRAVSYVPNSIATYVSYLFKAYPLDMSQFRNLFASSRLPCEERDELKKYDDSKHVVVMRKGNFFVFDIMDESGNAVAATQILRNIDHILQMDIQEPKSPLGPLTTTDRDSWTETRKHLLKIGNSEALEAIDSALLVLCLDEENLRDKLEKKIHSYLYGLTPNRWFDKSVSIMMDSSGDAALSFEHSWGDGVAVLRYFNELFDDSTTNHVVGPDTKIPDGVSSTVQQLQFKLDGKAEAAIAQAQAQFKASTDSLEAGNCILETFGKSTVKRAKLSPDSVIQLIIQLAYYKMYGHSPATYESCSTSAFKHGRTETVRSATPETLAFCRLISSNPDSSDLVEAIRKCSDKHNQLVKEAAMGKGWDRHLFALRKMAEMQGGKNVALFGEEAYQRINHIILSTSTLSSHAAIGGGFCAVTPDGYGVGYGIQEEGLGSMTTAYPQGGTSVPDFLTAFAEAAKEVKSVLDKASSS